jgi:hypothetical protein
MSADPSLETLRISSTLHTNPWVLICCRSPCPKTSTLSVRASWHHSMSSCVVGSQLGLAYQPVKKIYETRTRMCSPDMCCCHYCALLYSRHSALLGLGLGWLKNGMNAGAISHIIDWMPIRRAVSMWCCK